MRSEVKIALVVGLTVIVGAIIWTALDRKTEKQLDLLPESLSGLERPDGDGAQLVATTDLGRPEPERAQRREPPAQPTPRRPRRRFVTAGPDPAEGGRGPVVPAGPPPAPHLPVGGADEPSRRSSGPIVDVSLRPPTDAAALGEPPLRPQPDDVAVPPRRGDAQPASQPALQPPPPTTYTIREGDTFIRIARERLGDANLHTRIAEPAAGREAADPARHAPRRSACHATDSARWYRRCAERLDRAHLRGRDRRHAQQHRA